MLPSPQSTSTSQGSSSTPGSPNDPRSKLLATPAVAAPAPAELPRTGADQAPLLVAAVLLEAAVLCASRLERAAPRTSQASASEAGSRKRNRIPNGYPASASIRPSGASAKVSARTGMLYGSLLVTIAVKAIGVPLVNMIVFALILSRVARFDTGLPYPVYVYAGLLPWTFLANGLEAKTARERLTVSVRTVEGHLYRAGLKLGPGRRTGRSEP